MIDPTYNKTEIRTFQGPFTTPEESDVPNTRGLYALNVEYLDGAVATRKGYADVTFSPDNPDSVCTSMFNWIYSDPSAGAKNYLLWWATSPSAGLFYADLSSPTKLTAYTEANTYGASFANSGARVYVAQYNSSGLGVGHGRVFGFFGSGGAAATDTLFQRPMFTTEVSIGSSLSAGGSLTEGAHKLAVIIETRNGYLGRPSPVTNASPMILSPATMTVGSTDKTATITVTPATTWPSWVKKVHLLMTAVPKPSDFRFVPGMVASVTPGSGVAASFTVSISDDDLLRNGISADPYYNLLTQTNGNAAPFSPVAVFEAGNRIAYIVNDSTYGQCVFFSEPNNYQAINAAKSIRYLPGGRQIVAGFHYGGMNYLLGPNWTYGVQDTKGYPSTWPAEIAIDTAIGAFGPEAVSPADSQGNRWVASKNGLYRFSGGRYDVRPISYYNDDYWQRINAAQAHKIKVVDDANNKRVHVLVVLDSDTDPSGILTWDYSDGTTAERVHFSYDYLGLGYVANGIGIVQNNTSKRQEVWTAPLSTLAKFRRQKNSSDSNIYQDGNEGISSEYRTGKMLGGKGIATVSQHHGAHLRLQGSGSATLQVYSLDEALFANLSAVTMAAAPGKWILRRCYMLAEDVHYRISNGGTAGTYFILSGLTHYSNPHSMQR